MPTSDDNRAQGSVVVLPRGLVAAVVLAALPGVVFILYSAWFTVVPRDTTDEFAQSLMSATFVERAEVWFGQGAGSMSAMASLLALAAYCLIEVSPLVRVDPPLPDCVRPGAFWLTVVLAGLSVCGLAAVVVAYTLPADVSSSPRTINLALVFQGPAIAMCLVVVTLSGVIAWVLRHASTSRRATGDVTSQPHPESDVPRPQQLSPSPSPVETPPDPEPVGDIFRRPAP